MGDFKEVKNNHATMKKSFEFLGIEVVIEVKDSYDGMISASKFKPRNVSKRTRAEARSSCSFTYLQLILYLCRPEQQRHKSCLTRKKSQEGTKIYNPDLNTWLQSIKTSISLPCWTAAGSGKIKKKSMGGNDEVQEENFWRRMAKATSSSSPAAQQLTGLWQTPSSTTALNR